MQKGNGASINKNSLKLIILCFAVYFIAYLGRYSYSSNINPVMEYYGIPKAAAGSVGTFFFIAYGIGQVVNGLLCKKYNPKFAIALALLISGLTNVIVGFLGVQSFNLVKYFWLINGFAQSVLWSSIIRLLNGNLPKSSLQTAIFIMAMPVSLGTFAIYGLSSLISALNLSFKYVFHISSLLLFVISLVWFFSLDGLKNKCLLDRKTQLLTALNDETNQDIEGDIKKDNKLNLGKEFVITFGVLALFAIANNLVKDGLTTWMPALLKEKYTLSNSLSTFLTLFLPFFALFGSTFAIYLNKKTKNYILSCGALYLIAFLLFGGVLALMNFSIWILPLLCFILVACAMSGVNNLITNIFPMLYSHKVNAGTLAGILDGFCYVGSAITAYGMGAVADKMGWNAVFYLFLAICFLMILICTLYLLITKPKTKKA